MSSRIRLTASDFSYRNSASEESTAKATQAADSPGEEHGGEGQSGATDAVMAKSADADVNSERESAAANSESAETAGGKDERAEDSDTAESDQKLFQGKKRRRSVEKDASPAPGSTLERPAASEKPKPEGSKASARSPRPKKQKGARKEEKVQGTQSAGQHEESSKEKQPPTAEQHKSNDKSNSSCSDVEAQDKDGVALDGLKVPPLKIVLPQLSGEKEVANDVPAVPATKGKQLPYIVNSPLAASSPQPSSPASNSPLETKEQREESKRVTRSSQRAQQHENDEQVSSHNSELP